MPAPEMLAQDDLERNAQVVHDAVLARFGLGRLRAHSRATAGLGETDYAGSGHITGAQLRQMLIGAGHGHDSAVLERFASVLGGEHRFAVTVRGAPAARCELDVQVLPGVVRPDDATRRKLEALARFARIGDPQAPFLAAARAAFTAARDAVDVLRRNWARQGTDEERTHALAQWLHEAATEDPWIRTNIEQAPADINVYFGRDELTGREGFDFRAAGGLTDDQGLDYAPARSLLEPLRWVGEQAGDDVPVRLAARSWLDAQAFRHRNGQACLREPVESVDHVLGVVLARTVRVLENKDPKGAVLAYRAEQVVDVLDRRSGAFVRFCAPGELEPLPRVGEQVSVARQRDTRGHETFRWRSFERAFGVKR